MKERIKSWIFVSHSTKDIEQVRQIRNELEEKGADPILFFLKCIDDHAELDGLLKREIQARNFFLLCDSPNAADSNWVKQEIEYVKSLGNKKLIIVNVNDPPDKRSADLDQLVRSSTVFISYASADAPLIDEYVGGLARADFSLFVDRPDKFQSLANLSAAPVVGLSIGQSWMQQLDEQIRRAAKFVQFLSPRALASQVLTDERNAFVARNGWADVLLVDVADLGGAPLPPALASLQRLPAHTMSPHRVIDMIVQGLLR